MKGEAHKHAYDNLDYREGRNPNSVARSSLRHVCPRDEPYKDVQNDEWAVNSKPSPHRTAKPHDHESG